MKYYSHGKILFSAEYLVLYGATALAMPVRYGQSLVVLPLPSGEGLHWESTATGDFWFQARFEPGSLDIRYSNDEAVAGRLREILLAARSLNPAFLSGRLGQMVKADINFNRFWGLGTSSSLLSNIAWWAAVDPYDLHRKVSRGSGFDIACARSSSPLLFTLRQGKPLVEPVPFRPPFCKQMYFAYLGKKQDSENSVIHFLRKHPPQEQVLEEVSGLTREMLASVSLAAFNELLDRHEKILAGVIGEKPVRQNLFRDFPGGVKSLGAWGGDFVLLTWEGEYRELEKYLRKKDLYTVFGFDELILDPQAQTP